MLLHSTDRLAHQVPSYCVVGAFSRMHPSALQPSFLPWLTPRKRARILRTGSAPSPVETQAAGPPSHDGYYTRIKPEANPNKSIDRCSMSLWLPLSATRREAPSGDIATCHPEPLPASATTKWSRGHSDIPFQWQPCASSREPSGLRCVLCMRLVGLARVMTAGSVDSSRIGLGHVNR